MSFNDPFANLGDEEEKSKTPRPRPTPANKFDQPLEVTRRDVYRGLQALSNGERPEFEEVIVRRKLKPPTPNQAATV
jgi:hypothetical protein